MSRSRGVVNDLPARNRLAIVADIKNALIIFFLFCPVRKLAGYPREKKKGFNYAERNITRIYCNGNIFCAVNLDDVRSVTMISNEKMREYLQIAVLINSGAIPVPVILEDFQEHQERATEMINFWLTFDEFTQKVVNYLAIEKLRISFEKCYRKEVNIWTLTMHNLKVILNGLKQSLFGEREC